MSGKTTVENLILDARAICKRGRSLFDKLVCRLDGCIQADQSNDPNLTAGLELLEGAIDVCSDSRLKSILESAHAEFRIATDKDFTDTTKEALKAEILPWCEKFDGLDEDLESLMLKLKGNKDLSRESETPRD